MEQQQCPSSALWLLSPTETNLLLPETIAITINQVPNHGCENNLLLLYMIKLEGSFDCFLKQYNI